MSKNRIIQYLKEVEPLPQARCVVVSNLENESVGLSIQGNILEWKWRDGLISPGSSKPLGIHPLAAEAMVDREIEEFLSMEGISEGEVIYVDPEGTGLDGVVFHPICLGEQDYRITLKKDKINDLFYKYVENNFKLSEKMVGDAISFGVLEPFLSLVNL